MSTDVEVEVNTDAVACLWTELGLRLNDKNRSKLVDLEYSLLMLLLSTQSLMRKLEGRKPPVQEEE